MNTDISSTLEADSTQLNAIDFPVGTSRIYTVRSVRVTGGDQPVNIQMVESDKDYRPSKSQRRVLAACWGPDSATWSGHRFEVYTDPKVKWGGKEVGGIKVRAVSHIDAPVKVMLQESSTVRTPHVVQPLTDTPPSPDDLSARTNKAVGWFAAKGVQRSNLEAHVGRPVDEWTGGDLDNLTANRDSLVVELKEEK